MQDKTAMMNAPPLTRLIGEAERALQALLQIQLDRAGLAFAEWVVLNLLAGSGSLPAAELRSRIEPARIVAPGGEGALVEQMIGKGLLNDDGDLCLSDQGRDVFQPLRSAVGAITEDLVRDLSPDQIDAARQALQHVRRRAEHLLVDGGPAPAGGRIGSGNGEAGG